MTNTSTNKRELRVLCVHKNITGPLDLMYEYRQWISGLLDNVDAQTPLRIFATDCRFLYIPSFDGEAIQYERVSSLPRALVHGFDVAHILAPLPPFAQALTAVILRLRGIPVLLSPNFYLGDDFATSSWFKERSKLFSKIRPALLRLSQRIWRLIGSGFMCASTWEMQQAHLPPERCTLLPWAEPDTPLANSVRQDNLEPAEGHQQGPVAYIGRFSVWHKGIDRMCAWLWEHKDSLPRPALVLFALDRPSSDQVRITPVWDSREQWPPTLEALLSEGLIEWDKTTVGAAMIPRLRTCRAVILLSRWDGFPRVLREAALMGLPTISTPSCHFADAVEFLRKGAIVGGDDTDELQAAFEEAGNAPGDTERAKSLFDRATVGKFLGDLYLAVARRAPVEDGNYYRHAERRYQATRSGS